MKTSITLFNRQWIIKSFLIICSTALISACENSTGNQSSATSNAHGIPVGTETEAEIEKGSHGGRLLKHDNFTLELAIFETGVSPEFRAWASFKGQPLKPSEVQLKIRLTRLSNNNNGRVNEINFSPYQDALRGDSVVHEPHSFVVDIDATYNGKQYNWQYDNFEGRTKIEASVSEALKISTDIAGPVVLQQMVNVFGRVVANTEQLVHVSARFAGVIKSVVVSAGNMVSKGQILASVESNESLKRYSIKAPISGIITQRNANAGEQTGERTLFSIVDTSTVWVDLSVFPKHRPRVKVGASVSFTLLNNTESFNGKIILINVLAETNQSVVARLVVPNENGQLFPGSFVKAKIKVAEVAVPLAVKRSGLQSFRDFTVVYEKVGEEYEVRMLDLGRQDDEWIEVLGGLAVGAIYVTKNSYVIKADIEKSGASHDH